MARDVTQSNAQARRLISANAQLLGQNAQLVGQLETIEHLRADLVEQAGRDPLTDLHNRRYLVEHFGAMISAAERTGGHLAVVLVDVDRFKSVNDELGHLAGDALLVARARWGGEEFLVALPGADSEQGLAFADNLRAQCELVSIDVAGQSARCTISGGVAVFPASGTTMNALFHAADIALYEAKNFGATSCRCTRVPLASMPTAPR